jgi:hypothetical protein
MSAHVRVYRFDPGASFEGGLLAALERMQVGTDGELLDALFVRRDTGSGALEAVDLRTGVRTAHSHRCATSALTPAG